ncbi:MAG TPA: hypothetical protein VKV04_10670 [Verrucomicrobiae bacterium]|nr:hypothetical protein [Verrucomicrobiae bacterium]
MHTLSLPALGSSDTEGSNALNVVIAYEDLETGKRAMKTYDYLVEHLGDQCLFTNQMWKFDVLAVPKLRDIAAKDAVAADIIIVAAHEGNELPAEVKAWIQQWLSFNTRASALVGLFGAESVDTPVRDYLASIAKRAKIEFFCQPGLWPGKSNKHESNPTLAVLASVMQEDHEVLHWGINE